MSALKHITTVLANDTIPVHKYKSERTGLTVVIGEVDGPIVNGYFALATEAHDDDGLPHTLEHLIFLGSELYPYKGVLDLLANRCLACGTNAWTDTDHTCYTVQTVGKDGFLELMPIYLDHILYPTLSDAGFITEVHHIAPSGEDSGVVYCEMQGRENSGESRAWLEMARAIYPNSGYSAETGGIMHNLRTSTTNEKVRQFHSEFYRPENLTIIITGQVNVEDVANALEAFETRILSKEAKAPFERPWQTPIEPLTASTNKRIVYPSDTEDCGIVHVGWRGPSCVRENHKLTACSVLLRYLSESAVSPLQHEMVEIPDPFASNVSYNIVENSESLIYFSFQNVPIEKIDLVEGKMQHVLSDLADGKEKFDMQRMQNILELCILEYFSSMETSPHEAIAFPVVADALYGNTSEDFEARLNVNKTMKMLLTKDESYWNELLKAFLIDGKYVVIRAVPSIEEQKRMAKEEANRIEQQRKTLGAEGLRKKAEELNAAMATNEIPPPQSMLTEVPIPDITNIKSLPSTLVERGNSKTKGTIANLDLERFGVHVMACHVDTAFVYMTTYFNTHTIAPELRPYLTLFFDLLSESPIRRADGVLIPYEEVCKQLESDTVSVDKGIGLESGSQFTCGSFSNTAQLTIKADYRKYKIGIQWIVDLLNRTEFTVDRIRACAAKIANAVSQAKRRGNAIAYNLIDAMFYPPQTNIRVCSMIHQHRFLSALLEHLNDEKKAEKIIKDLNRLRSEIVSTKRLSLYIAADFKKVVDAEQYATWNNLIRPDDVFTPENFEGPIRDYKLRKSIVSDSQILGLGCIEGAYLVHAVPCPIEQHDDGYVPLQLFMQYFTQLEGPFWRQIRGQGLSYGYNMSVRLHSQMLLFTLYRATNVVAAFKQFQSITTAQLADGATWDAQLLESAKSSLIFDWIEREKCVNDVVWANLVSCCFLKSDPISAVNQANIRKLKNVTIADIKAAGNKFVKQFFTSNARTSVVCHPDKVVEISADFKEMGIKLTESTNIETSLLGQLDV